MSFKNLVANRLRPLARLTFLGLLLLGFSNIVWSKGFYAQLKKELNQLKIKKTAQRNDPDYPAYLFMRTINSMQKFDADVIIRELEGLLLSKEFQVRLRQLDKETFRVELGTAGSFSLWRDLFYITLGRAYYDKKLWSRAKAYFGNVNVQSPYFGLASIQYNYSLFQMHKLKLAKERLEQLKTWKWLSSETQREFKLQQAFVDLRSKDYAAAIKMAQATIPKRGFVLAFRNKILAEAHFKKFLIDYAQIDFTQRIQRLQTIESLVDSIPLAFRNSELAYLAAESFWHHASALRVQDPIKNKKEWHEKLSRGENWLGHYVKKSIRANKPLMSEEAFFFSVFLLWEREQYQQALSRLTGLHIIYPQGIYRADAYQLVADYYYDQNQFNRAIIYYRKLAKIGAKDKASYAVYKAGWSFYNLEKKWKALRHFERLVKFYQDEKKKPSSGPSELEKESRQDFILVVAETMQAQEAIKEIESIGFGPLDLVLVKSDLAKIYQKIGRFKQAIVAWEHVLDRYHEHQEYLAWLVNLAQDYHSLGNRVKVASQVEHYYEQWVKLAKQRPDKQRRDFFNEWEKLILSIHKEARKTDDPQIWMATDHSYNVFKKLGRPHENGKLWYFGAQRMERQAKLWEAVNWYQNASLDKSFQLGLDSGLSALRLTHQINEDLSIETDEKKKIQEYKRVAGASKWFILHFPKSLQLELAQSVYIEALYQSKDFQVALEYFKQVLTTGEFVSAWKLYQSFNNRLYLSKDWQRAYEFSSAIEGLSNIESQKKLQFVRDIRKEAAFQLAYQFEKQKVKDLNSIAKWYGTSINIRGELDATLKAWHNLVLNFTEGHEKKLYESLERFLEKKYTIQKKEHINLAFNMFKHGINVFEKQGNLRRKAFALFQGSRYATYDEISRLMLWESLILFSTYQAWESWDRVLSEIQSKHPDYLKQSEQKLTLARLYFYRKDFRQAWKLLETDLDAKNTGQAHWQLMLDLYNNVSDSSSLFNDLENFIQKNQKRLSKVGTLQIVWHYWHRKEWEADQEKLLEGRSEVKRGIASVDDKLSDQAPIEKLKAKLQHVSSLLQGLKVEKELINKYLKVQAPQIAREAICKAPQMTQASIESLEQLKENPVESAQWKDFIAKLDNKINELQKITESEQRACEKIQREFVYFEKRENLASVLCSGEFSCLTSHSLSAEELRTMEVDMQQLPREEQFIRYVENGALARAELLSIQEKDVQRRLFYNALLRLALNDKIGAEGFLDELSKSDHWKYRAKNLKTYMAYKQAPEGFKAVDKKTWKTERLTSSERKWFQAIP